MVLTTEVDRLYELILKHKKVSIIRASKVLKEKSAIVENWAKVLEESGLIQIDYSFNPFAKAYLKVIENDEKNTKKEQ